MLELFVHQVSFPNKLSRLHSNTLTSFSPLNVLMFYLHRVDNLFKISHWSLHENSITNRQRRRKLHDGDADLREEMRYVPDFNNFFLTQTLQPLNTVLSGGHKKLVKTTFQTLKPKA